MFKSLKFARTILFFSLGIIVFRFITSPLFLIITGNWLINDSSGYFFAVLSLVIGDFGQVIASFITGVFCGMRFLYRKPKTCGITIVLCTSFFFALLYTFSHSPRTSFLLGLTWSVEAILIVLSILAVLAGIKLGGRKRRLRYGRELGIK